VVEALGEEVRSRRLIVIDEQGHERVVAEVAHGQAELRVQLPPESPPSPDNGTRSPGTALIFACPDSEDLGAGLGVQLWAGGDILGEFDAWSDGRLWSVTLHIEKPREEDATERSVD
jgi:hypothetical protein